MRYFGFVGLNFFSMLELFEIGFMFGFVSFYFLFMDLFQFWSFDGIKLMSFEVVFLGYRMLNLVFEIWSCFLGRLEGKESRNEVGREGKNQEVDDSYFNDVIFIFIFEIKSFYFSYY